MGRWLIMHPELTVRENLDLQSDTLCEIIRDIVREEPAMDKMRWRFGDTNPVVAAVDEETVVEIGDLVFQEEDDARPASERPQIHSTEIAQESFAKKFLGVAMQRSRKGDADPIRVATTGVFEFDCPAGTFELGDLVGPRYLEGRLANQEVIGVDYAIFAVGRVAKRQSVAEPTVLVAVQSTVMTGGIR